MLRVSKQYNFAAAHHLPNHKGKCKRPHGHNYLVVVIIRGELIRNARNSQFGMVLDFDKLDQIVDPIIDYMDHQDLNDERFGWSKTQQHPTAEVIASCIGIGIKEHLPKRVTIYSVEVFETPKASATWLP